GAAHGRFPIPPRGGCCLPPAPHGPDAEPVHPAGDRDSRPRDDPPGAGARGGAGRRIRIPDALRSPAGRTTSTGGGRPRRAGVRSFRVELVPVPVSPASRAPLQPRLLPARSGICRRANLTIPWTFLGVVDSSQPKPTSLARN